MKTNKSTPTTDERIVWYNYIERCMFIDDVRIDTVYVELFCNMTESCFAGMTHRDPSIERLFRLAGSMFVNFNRHHRVEDVYDWGDMTYRPRLVDENPEESMELMFQVKECCSIIMKRIFQGEWKTRTRYIGMVFFMMQNVCYNLQDFNVYLSHQDEVSNMVPRE